MVQRAASCFPATGVYDGTISVRKLRNSSTSVDGHESANTHMLHASAKSARRKTTVKDVITFIMFYLTVNGIISAKENYPLEKNKKCVRRSTYPLERYATIIKNNKYVSETD